MYTFRKLAGGLLLAALLLGNAGCGSKAPAASPTLEPSATTIPTKTPKPTATATKTPEPSPTAAASRTSIAGPATTGLPSLSGTLAAGTAPALPTAAAATLPPVSGVAEKAQYVTQNLPDNYQTKPGTLLTIVWTVKNIGKTEWDTSCMLRWFTGPKGDKTSIAFPKKVAPNATVDLTVTFTAPSEPGTYNSWWKLTNAAGQNFADVNFVFIVTAAPGTAAPTATP